MVAEEHMEEKTMQSLESVEADKKLVRTAYEQLRRAYHERPFPSAAERQDRLERLEGALARAREELVAAVSEDFGGRSRHETLMADVLATLDTIREARRSVGEWMKRRSVPTSRYFVPSKAFVEYLPKGVVGIIAPWNYPVNLALAPLACALAAGNRVIVKPSELTPRTAAWLGRMVRETFSAEEVAAVEGGPEVARALTELPLDHLLFTGSTAVGRLVAAAAARNLTPLTLELGGKSPVLVHPDYPIARAAERIAVGKLFNAGQTCIAPDYALIAEGRAEAFAAAFRAAVERLYPDLANNEQYSSIATKRGLDRLRALLDDAAAKGARVETIAPGGEAPADSRKLAPALLFGVEDGMRVIEEEIFGPLLPVRTYRTVDEAVELIRARPRPLAFYYFDDSSGRANDVLSRVVSGGACVNDTMLHFAQEELPFGGVGESGMGAYHGRAGFETFSHARGVFVASRLSAAAKILAPPYGKALAKALDFFVGR